MVSAILVKFITIVLLILTNVVDGGKRQKRTRASETDIDDINETEYKDRTLIQWLNVNKEGLVLICNNLNLNSRGDAGTLARRLHNHFNQHPLLSKI